MVGYLLALLVLAVPPASVPDTGTVAVVQGVQEPSKAKPAPKQQPQKPQPTRPSGGGSAGGRQPSSGGGGAARPQPPRGGQAAPKATGEPRLQRRGR